MLLQYLRNQYEAYVTDLDTVYKTLENVKIAQEAITSLKDETSKEMLVPLGGSTFVKATLKDPDSILVGVGADLIVRKSGEGAQEILKSQESNLNDAKSKLESSITDITTKLRTIEAELQKQAQDAQKLAGKEHKH